MLEDTLKKIIDVLCFSLSLRKASLHDCGGGQCCVSIRKTQEFTHPVDTRKLLRQLHDHANKHG